MKTITYLNAGVDINAGDELVERIKPLSIKTMRPEVIAGIGGFGSLFEISKKYNNPVLVSGTDGVGTKLKLAFELNRHNTIGIDLVAMCVNDILTQGAEPLFFLDYFACGKLNVNKAEQVITGITNGCILSRCALIGGETAEMPGMYPVNEYDLAGFAVGVVEKDKIINGKSIIPGDVILGISSSGAHSNGYSLIRKIIESNKIDLYTEIDDKLLCNLIMSPTRIYVNSVLNVIKNFQIKGLAHITGGGLIGNIPRILPDSVKAILQKNSWKMPTLFSWLQEQGNIDEQEMFRTFNCGIGMTLIVPPEDVDNVMSRLKASGETVWKIGMIESRQNNEQSIIIE